MKQLFTALLNLSAWLAQQPKLNGLTNSFMNMLAGLTMRSRKAKPKQTIEAIAHEWQRMFVAGKKTNRITAIENGTAYAEIHTQCPLRATGDVKACYKMMQYDRKMLNTIGGQFVVLQSQSNSGETYCKVAMRVKGADMSDLQEAHLIKSL